MEFENMIRMIGLDVWSSYTDEEKDAAIRKYGVPAGGNDLPIYPIKFTD